MSIRIGNAPCSWGVEFAQDERNPTWQNVLLQCARSGYTGIELGPVGFMPEDPAQLADALAEHSLELIGGVVFRAFHDKAQWDDVMEVNLKSVFNLTKHILKPMLKNRGGSIINMSSVVGVFGNAGQANYAASKAGIIGFTKSIAKEVGSRNIRCNSIAPGFIATEMTDELDEKVKESYTSSIPLKRFGTVEDVASACVYLGSDLSTYVSGQVLSVCGAMNT